LFTTSIKYYDLIYSALGINYQQESEQLHRLIKLYKRSKGKRLLDVACGTGGHLQYLQKDYQVEGLDLSQQFLRLARHKLPRVPFHQGNMLDFKLKHSFDIVTCLFSSIGYIRNFSQLVKTIQNMKHHLCPGGLLIIEPWLSPGEYKTGTVHAAIVDQPDLKIARINTSKVKGKLSVIVFHYLIAKSSGVKYFTEKHTLGLFQQEEYLKAFKTCRLKTVYDPAGLKGRGLYIGINQF
jgi:ubiquinone/menaquinone biosynthesis C-methylase UbiE